MRRAKRKREKSIKQLAAAVELSRALGAPSTWTKRAYLLCIIFHSFHILIQYWNFIPWNQVPAYKVPFQVRRTVIIASKIQRQHLLPSLIPHSLDSFHSSPPLSLWYRLSASTADTVDDPASPFFHSTICSITAVVENIKKVQCHFECENEQIAGIPLLALSAIKREPWRRFFFFCLSQNAIQS